MRGHDAAGLAFAHPMMALADFVLIGEPSAVVLRAASFENPLAETLAHGVKMGAHRLAGRRGEIAQQMWTAAHEAAPNVEDRLDLRLQAVMRAFQRRDVDRPKQKRSLDLLELRAGDHAAGLNPAQAEALRYLARANRFSRTPAALAEFLGSTRGTVSQTLISLEAKGLIERRANARDGRSILFDLTRAGSAFLRANPDQILAAAIDHPGIAGGVAANLEAGLRAAIAMRGGRAFGACNTCRHFRRDQRKGATPHHCALLDEQLGETDASLVCAEQTAA